MGAGHRTNSATRSGARQGATLGEEVKAAKRIEDQRKAAVWRSQTQQQTARNAQIETLRRLAVVQKEKS